MIVSDDVKRSDEKKKEKSKSTKQNRDINKQNGCKILK